MTTPDLSRRSGGAAEADHLDAAIDRVAARMVAVPDDGELTLRIVTALPERTSRLRWLIPQLAAIGAIVVAALVWTTRHNTAPAIATLPSSTVAPSAGRVNAVAADEPGSALRTSPLESAYARDNSRELRRDLAVAASGRVGGHLEGLEPMELAVMTSVDHERALSPIEAVSALVVTDLAPPELPATAALELASIEITDLPLTAESFPPR